MVRIHWATGLTVFGGLAVNEAAISRKVYQEDAIDRVLLEARGEEDKKLAEGRSEEKVLVRVLTPIDARTAFETVLIGRHHTRRRRRVKKLAGIFLWFPFKCLQHSEHVQGKFAKFNLSIIQPPISSAALLVPAASGWTTPYNYRRAVPGQSSCRREEFPARSSD